MQIIIKQLLDYIMSSTITATATVIKTTQQPKTTIIKKNDNPKTKQYQPLKDNSHEFFRPLHMYDDHYDGEKNN
jgi:hypothetical protein